MPILSQHNIDAILKNELKDPFDILGMHRESTGLSVRAFLPEAQSVILCSCSKGANIHVDMIRINESGIFEAHLPDEINFFKYEFLLTLHDKKEQRLGDPYSFLPCVSEQARYLFNEGTNQRVYDDLGSHVRTIDNVQGTIFAVWAPNAKRVSLVGNFNNWDGRRHPMRPLGLSGVWELFVPGLLNGTIYKYEIKKQDNDHLILKTDPYGYYQEPPPNHASIVWDLDSFGWTDQNWLQTRQKRDLLNQPMTTYEVHLASWKKSGPAREGDYLTYKDLAHDLAAYVKEMGFTHIELMPIQDHPFVPSWGYQVCGFFAPNHRFGTPDDFQYFVNHMHEQGIGVIMDWVPGHFPKDAYGLAHFDGTHLYEYADPREGEHKDWGTLIFNFARFEVRNFLIANALFWIEKFHIDGLRVDAVASMLYRNYSRKNGEWIPNIHGEEGNLEAISLLKTINCLVHEKFPGVLTIAEESTAWPMVSRPTDNGGLGFSLKWNMGWMNDMLSYFTKDPVYRKHHQNQITFGLWYAFSENFVLVLSHDEVVHGKRSLVEKMPGDIWQKFANARLFFGYMYGHPGKKLMFQGCEFGMHWEWNAEQSINWHILTDENDAPYHRGLKTFVSDLNKLYKKEVALWEHDFDNSGFLWIDHGDAANSVVSFVRYGTDRTDYLIFACSFTPVLREHYRIGVPDLCSYREILSSDAPQYGGSGVSNTNLLKACSTSWHNQPFSLELTLPPLGIVVLKKER